MSLLKVAAEKLPPSQRSSFETQQTNKTTVTQTFSQGREKIETVALVLTGRALYGEGATNLKALAISLRLAIPMARKHQGET